MKDRINRVRLKIFTMHYYKATIQYDGTDYAGFQWQKEVRTIQDDLNQAIDKLTEGKFSISGASRTDKGVHAVEQVVRITAENPIECSSFIRELNRMLSSQIRCLKLAPCSGEFNPNRDTISKEYRYLFTNTTRVAMSDRRFISNIANPLDFRPMQACMQMIMGTHDFCNFVSTGSSVKTTIREVSSCELTEINPHDVFLDSPLFQIPSDLRSCYQLKIEAPGFLKQMIRHLVAALWMVGSGRISTAEFCDLLDGQHREKRLWKPASSRGLYLYRIHYPS